MGLTTPTGKILPVRKPEMWSLKGLMKILGTGRSSCGIEGYGGGPLWRRSALGCSTNEDDSLPYLIENCIEAFWCNVKQNINYSDEQLIESKCSEDSKHSII